MLGRHLAQELVPLLEHGLRRTARIEVELDDEERPQQEEGQDGGDVLPQDRVQAVAEEGHDLEAHGAHHREGDGREPADHGGQEDGDAGLHAVGVLDHVVLVVGEQHARHPGDGPGHGESGQPGAHQVDGVGGSRPLVVTGRDEHPAAAVLPEPGGHEDGRGQEDDADEVEGALVVHVDALVQHGPGGQVPR